MNEISSRLSESIEFLIKNGSARSQREIARELGVTASTLNMAVKGSRIPSMELLLDFCDHYPINFWWLRTGKGKMIAVDRERELLQRIAELEMEMEKLKTTCLLGKG